MQQVPMQQVVNYAHKSPITLRISILTQQPYCSYLNEK